MRRRGSAAPAAAVAAVGAVMVARPKLATRAAKAVGQLAESTATGTATKRPPMTAAEAANIHGRVTALADRALAMATELQRLAAEVTK